MVDLTGASWNPSIAWLRQLADLAAQLDQLKVAARHFARCRVGRRGQYLQGDIAPQPGVARPVHLAHASRPDGREHVEGAKTGTGACRATARANS
jgi:hypothetical protein